MEKKVHEVVPRGTEPEELDIHHVGYPGQGMPVRGMARGECPCNTAPGYALEHMAVFGYIDIVVKVDKFGACYLPEGKDGHEDKEEGDDGQKVLRRKRKPRGRRLRGILCGYTVASLFLCQKVFPKNLHVFAIMISYRYE